MTNVVIVDFGNRQRTESFEQAAIRLLAGIEDRGRRNEGGHAGTSSELNQSENVTSPPDTCSISLIRGGRGTALPLQYLLTMG